MQTWPTRLLVLGAILLLVSAAVMAVAVIPPVRIDTFPLATPQAAARALWGNALLNVSAAAAALAALQVNAAQASLRRLLPVVAGVVGVLLGLLLIQAAAALSPHGPALHGAVVALRVCVGCGILGGGSLIVSNFGRTS
ncbi:MAG TPA: hypothetical protein VEH83_05170 [Gemmatimonadales bacterium]|nr:hypothetical protein [Gemmatimonadales bacterium]